MTESLVGGASAAPLSMRATAVVASAVVRAARQLLTDLERGRRIDAAGLRAAMEAAFGASDTSGAWNWKTAYEACEAATVLFLRRHGAAMRAKATSPTAMLPMLTKIANLLPTQTRRSLESESLQQFSTPIGLACVASIAAAITPADLVLEPSAGTGLLAVFAELSGASLILNEFAETRAGILATSFPGVSTTPYDAAHINDHLDAGIVPSVVLMNPPFSAAIHVDRRMADAALRHVASALARLPEGGRLVSISGANVGPDNCAWTDSFIRLQESSRVVFSAAIEGAVYAKHGTNIDTRLTVIDRMPADDVAIFPASSGIAPDLPTLLGWVMQYVPPRHPVAGKAAAVVPAIASLQSLERSAPTSASASRLRRCRRSICWQPNRLRNRSTGRPQISARITDALYEEYMPRQRGYSSHSCEAYAYSFRLLFTFAAKRIGTRPSQLLIEQLDAPLILDFLGHIERERGNGVATRNLRLAAIKTFMRYVEYQYLRLWSRSVRSTPSPSSATIRSLSVTWSWWRCARS